MAYCSRYPDFVDSGLWTGGIRVSAEVKQRGRRCEIGPPVSRPRRRNRQRIQAPRRNLSLNSIAMTSQRRIGGKGLGDN